MKAECVRCGRVAECHKHHTYRRRNNEEVVNLCWECHHWTHMNPGAAKKEGLYKEMDGKYRGHIKLD